MSSPDYPLPSQNEFDRAMTLAQSASNIWAVRHGSGMSSLSLLEYCDHIQVVPWLNPLNLSARQIRRVYFEDEKILLDFIAAARRL